MALETATYIHELNAANPTGADQKLQGDDHIRLVKDTLQNTFPNLTGAVSATQDDLNKTTNITDGKYTPATAAFSGVSAVTPDEFFYTRSNNIVYVEGSAAVTLGSPPANASFDVVLPIARATNWANINSAHGHGVNVNVGGGFCYVSSILGGVNNRVRVNIVNGINGNYKFHFTYKLD